MSQRESLRKKYSRERKYQCKVFFKFGEYKAILLAGLDVGMRKGEESKMTLEGWLEGKVKEEDGIWCVGGWARVLL